MRLRRLVAIAGSLVGLSGGAASPDAAPPIPGAVRVENGWWVPSTGLGGGFGAYEAAKSQRQDPDWPDESMGPNALAEAFGGLDLITRRVRWLMDNNELFDAAAETWCDYMVGTGIDDVEADTGFEDLDGQINDVWEWARERVDPERQMSLAESQRLFVRELFVGEVGVHTPMAPAFKGYPAMPAIELFERERVPMDLTGTLPSGNTVRQGVEYDPKGRTVAYHVLVAHPRDNEPGLMGGASAFAHSIGTAATMRIGVDRLDLAFRSRRISQLRGVPRSVSAMRTVREEDGFRADSLWQARLHAMMGVYFSGDNPPDMFQQKGGKLAACVDALGRPIVNLGRSIGFLRKGNELKTVEAKLPGPTFESTEAVMQRRMGRGLGVGYATFSGDSSKTTFSSMRGESLNDRKGWRPGQRFVWDHHTAPWRRSLIDWAILVGRVTLTAEHERAFAKNPTLLYKCNPGFPGFEYVNPAQEAMAIGEDIDNGVRSEIEAIQERGGNWRSVVRNRVKYKKFLLDECERQGVPIELMSRDGTVPDAGDDERNDEETGEPAGDRRTSRLHRMGLAASLEAAHDAPPRTHHNGDRGHG